MIKFTAALKSSGNCIKIDSENAAEITFSVSASEISELIKLVTLTGKQFKVSVEDLSPVEEAKK